MIVLHSLQLNGSVNYYRKCKIISFEVGVKLNDRENSKFSKKSKIVVQIYWMHVLRVRPPAGAPGVLNLFYRIILHVFTHDK